MKGEGIGFGKIILFNEHFVVYGIPSIVSAIGNYTIAKISPFEIPDYKLTDNRSATPKYKSDKINQQKESLDNILKDVIRKVFDQCYLMDRMNINKEEMHHPYKHIIVRKNQPILIDFERTNYSRKPKNVTQMFQFLMSGRFGGVLRKKGLRINKKNVIKTSKKYKKEINKKYIKKIIDSL